MYNCLIPLCDTSGKLSIVSKNFNIFGNVIPKKLILNDFWKLNLKINDNEIKKERDYPKKVSLKDLEISYEIPLRKI